MYKLTNSPYSNLLLLWEKVIKSRFYYHHYHYHIIFETSVFLLAWFFMSKLSWTIKACNYQTLVSLWKHSTSSLSEPLGIMPNPKELWDSHLVSYVVTGNFLIREDSKIWQPFIAKQMCFQVIHGSSFGEKHQPQNCLCAILWL